jgi:hypothetical protein
VIRQEPRSLHLAYKGTAEAVMKWIARFPVERISTPEVPLERAFVRLMRGKPGPPVQPGPDVSPSPVSGEPPPVSGGPAGPVRAPFPFALLRFWIRRLSLGWTLIAVTIFLFQIGVCGSLHDSETIKAMLAYLDLLPSFIKDLFGGEALQLGKIESLLAMGYEHPLVLLLFMVFAVAAPTCLRADTHRQAALLPGETQRGTMELILSRSVAKTQAYICAALPVLVGMFAIALGMYLGTVVGTMAFEFDQPIPLGLLFRFAVNGALLAATVGAIALLSASIFRQRGVAVGLCVAYLVMNYFVYFFSRVWSVMEPLLPLTLFAYADDSLISAQWTWPVADMAVLGTILALSVLAGGMIWRRRDLPA